MSQVELAHIEFCGFTAIVMVISVSLIFLYALWITSKWFELVRRIQRQNRIIEAKKSENERLESHLEFLRFK